MMIRKNIGRWTALFTAVCFIAVTPAHAQELLLPDLDLQPPGIVSYAPTQDGSARQSVDYPSLILQARLSEDAPLLETGMIWRIFDARLGPDSRLPLVATLKGGSAQFQLPAGDYLIHGAFGRASATSRISLTEEGRQEILTLNAGGLKLDGMLPVDANMDRTALFFDIYEDEIIDGERRLILPDVPANQTVRLPAGTYHIVSRYGDVNATIRADLRVEAGKVTQAALEHRAAQIVLNLLRDEDGFPLPDTSWAVLSEAGERVSEAVGPYPSMILAAGNYTVIASNREQFYQHDITVSAGVDQTVRVITTRDQMQ